MSRRSKLHLTKEQLQDSIDWRVEDLREGAVLQRLDRAKRLADSGNKLYQTEFSCAAEIAFTTIEGISSGPVDYRWLGQAGKKLDETYKKEDAAKKSRAA